MSNNRNKEESFYDDKEEYRRSLRLIDDDFMTLFFNNFNEGAQLLLDIILDRKDIKVKSVHTQEIMKSLTGRDVWLDILATDEEGNKYNIEIQRAAPGADRRRARYHSSMIDSSMMPPNSDFSDLGENYVIFITEHDILGLREPIYHIDRFVEESGEPFNDGEHIIYVNASMRNHDTKLGKLMNDLYCREVSEMHYKTLSKRVKYYKETEKGEMNMNETIEAIHKKWKEEACIENAIKMLNLGKNSFEEIAECTGLSIEKIRALAEGEAV